MKNLVVFSLIIFCAGCTSINQAAHVYFTHGSKIRGVESYAQAKTRAQKYTKVRKIIYENLAQTKVFACILLRHQFYSAVITGVSGSAGKEIRSVALILEEAYQQDDKNFLQACEQVSLQELGKIFLAAQARYNNKSI